MSKITVTKREILKAIKTEPLLDGNWVHVHGDSWNNEYNKTLRIAQEKYKTCAVCAVGSFMNKKVANAGEVCMNIVESGCYDDSPATVKEAIGISTTFSNEGKHLTALSSLFEYLMENRAYKTKIGLANYRTRRILTNFVKKNFPTTLQLDTHKSY